ncbi:MAG: SRPBCC family protein [Candidatus Kapaibacterium sp.]
MKNLVTVKETVFVATSPEIVWDFTQDYERRVVWDKSIITATVIQDKPTRIVEVKGKGNLRAKFRYKLDDRPNKSSLAMVNTESCIVEGGGGSWSYLPRDYGTLWTQTNTLILKKGLLTKLLRPIIAYLLRQRTRASMELAKQMIEQSVPSSMEA